MPSLSDPRQVVPWTTNQGVYEQPRAYSSVNIHLAQIGGWHSIPLPTAWALEFLCQIPQLEPVFARVLPFHARMSTSPSPLRLSKELPSAPSVRARVPSFRHCFHRAPCKFLLPTSVLRHQPNDELVYAPPSLYIAPPVAARGNHKWLLVGLHPRLTLIAPHMPEER